MSVSRFQSLSDGVHCWCRRTQELWFSVILLPSDYLLIHHNYEVQSFFLDSNGVYKEKINDIFFPVASLQEVSMWKCWQICVGVENRQPQRKLCVAGFCEVIYSEDQVGWRGTPGPSGRGNAHGHIGSALKLITRQQYDGSEFTLKLFGLKGGFIFTLAYQPACSSEWVDILHLLPWYYSADPWLEG